MTDLPDYLTLSRDEREAIILPPYINGASAGQISLMLHNASRNAIIGAITRAIDGGRVERRFYARPVRKARVPRSRQSTTVKMFIPDAEPVMIATTAWDALPGTMPVSLVELETGMCKWPLDGHLFCGAPAEGVYCPTHHRMAYKAVVPSAQPIKFDGHAKRVGI